MNETALNLLIIVAGLTGLTCVICAAILLWHQRKGWGWFLFAAVAIAALGWPALRY